MAEALYDPAFLARLEYLSLASRRLVRGLNPAQRRSHRLGGGIEFADHRPHSSGDDCRDLDWHAYARLDALFIKRFQEEQDLSVYILVDVSKSMAIGEPSKLSYAKQVAAALAYIALNDLDRVALTAFSGRPVKDYPTARGKGSTLPILRFLGALEADANATDLAATAAEFVRRSPRRGLVAVVSDFLDKTALRNALEIFRRNRFELLAVQVFADGEADPPLKGDVEFEDVETGERRRLTVTENLKRQYQVAFEAHRRSLLDYCKEYGFAAISRATSTPLPELILPLLRGAAA